MEYSSYKIPTVASKVYPYFEDIIGKKTIQQGKTGYLAKTTKDWVKYIELLISNSQLRDEMGKNAYNFVKENWQMKDNYYLYEDLFESIICSSTTQLIKTE